MILNKETDILKEIKLKKHNIFYIYGNENYLKRNYYSKLLEIYGVNLDDTFNFHEFSYQKSDVDDVVDACLTLPLFADKKCVVVKDVEINAIPKYDTDKLISLINEVPDECVLIFLQMAVEVDDRRSAKDKKFIGAVDKNGVVVKISSRSENNTIKFITDYVKKLDMKISSNNAKYLIDRCGNSFDMLSVELEKLCSYDMDNGEISRESIDKLVSVNLDTSVYELSKSILRQDYNRAMNILSKLQQMQEEPMMVFGVLSSIYVDLFRAKSALNDGYDADVVTHSFSYRGREFLVRNAMSDARNLSWYFIAGALAILMETDIDLKSGLSNGYLVLEKTVAELFILRADGR